MYYRKEYLTRAHREIDTIFRVLFPEHGMAVREVEYMPCYADWRERRELKHLHICSGIILQMQDEKMDGN